MSVATLTNTRKELRKLNIDQLKLWSIYTIDAVKTERQVFYHSIRGFKCLYLSENILL